MLTFNPPRLEDELRRSAKALEDYASIELLGHALEHDFDPSQFPPCTVEEKTELQLSFIRSEEVAISVGELLSICQEFEPTDLTFDGLIFTSKRRSTIRVQSDDQRTYQLLENLPVGNTQYFPITTSLNDIQIHVGLVRSSVPFALAVLKWNFYSDKYFPALSHYDVFVELQHQSAIPREAALDVAHAYLFELGATLDLRFSLFARPEAEGDYPDEDELEKLSRGTSLLRPLLLGPGLGPLLREFQKAVSAPEDEIAVLCFAKCIEYVSASVVRAKQYEEVRKRLLGRSALDPTATFIDDLADLFEENRLFMKDHEALRITIERCCDATVLAPLCPPCITARISGKDAKADARGFRKTILAEFSSCLSATRNMLAHAKANYETTGRECPDAQMNALARCTRAAAEQCIRWYADQNPALRRF